MPANKSASFTPMVIRIISADIARRLRSLAYLPMGGRNDHRANCYPKHSQIKQSNRQIKTTAIYRMLAWVRDGPQF
jgi:hypothetical protein